MRLIDFFIVTAGEQRSAVSGTWESHTAPEHPSHPLAPHLLSVLGTIYLLRVSGDDQPFPPYSSGSICLRIWHNIQYMGKNESHLNVPYLTGTVLDTLHVLTHLILITIR